MRKFCTIVRMSLLLVACGSQARDWRAGGQAQAVASLMEHQITAKEAMALEEGLATNPDNLTAREQLISYYFAATIKLRSPEFEEKREQHVLWLKPPIYGHFMLFKKEQSVKLQPTFWKPVARLGCPVIPPHQTLHHRRRSRTVNGNGKGTKDF